MIAGLTSFKTLKGLGILYLFATKLSIKKLQFSSSSKSWGSKISKTQHQVPPSPVNTLEDCWQINTYLPSMGSESFVSYALARLG